MPEFPTSLIKQNNLNYVLLVPGNKLNPRKIFSEFYYPLLPGTESSFHFEKIERMDNCAISFLDSKERPVLKFPCHPFATRLSYSKDESYASQTLFISLMREY